MRLAGRALGVVAGYPADGFYWLRWRQWGPFLFERSGEGTPD
jgi:hypothetical protein